MHSIAQGQPWSQSDAEWLPVERQSMPPAGIRIPIIGADAMSEVCGRTVAPGAAEAGPMVGAASRPTIARTDRHRAMRETTFTRLT
jgi:hypothetical protein